MIIRYCDCVTAKDVRDAIDALALRPGHSYRFLDLSRVTQVQVDFSMALGFTERIAQMIRNSGGTMTVSYFAPSALGFGMARMGEQLLNTHPGIKAAVSGTRADAIDHLGLPSGSPDVLRALHVSETPPNLQMMSHSSGETG